MSNSTGRSWQARGFKFRVEEVAPNGNIRVRRYKYPYAIIAEGEEFLILRPEKFNSLRVRLCNYGKRTGKRFRTEISKTGLSMKVWRAA